MPKLNTIIMGDSVYEMSDAYLAGARDFRQGVSFHFNPHRHGSQRYDDWDAGHTHDAAHEHYRFGIDLIEAPRTGREFAEDEAVPRDKDGNVDEDWAEQFQANLRAAA